MDLAYPLVVRDYLDREATTAEAGTGLDGAALGECADHFHNFWVNRKLWWPTDDAGRPDWAGIYVFIIDHYYGYCLRRNSAK